MNEISLSQILSEAAHSGTLVLCATKRLARHLRSRFDSLQVQAGRKCWLSPSIYSGDDWFRRAADSLGDGWRLLTPQPARRLWEGIIEAEEDGGESGLLQVAATARAADEANALLTEYRLNPENQQLTADHQSFLRWRRSYLDFCRKEGWLDHAALAEAVISHAACGELELPSVLWLAGFDEIPPRIRRLAQTMATRGTGVRELSPGGASTGDLLRIPCADARDEVRQAARWARRLLERGETEIGVIVPDLEGYRGLIERIFREEIDPEAAVRPGGDEVRFNLSLGTPLANTGAVTAALEILGAAARIPLPVAGFLLRTPYLGGAERERGGRAILDRKLRADRHPTVNLASLARQSGEGEKHIPRKLPFSEICRELLLFLRDGEKRLPGSWATRFALLLASIGWPGERSLDSFDYQVVKAWHEKALSRMGAFDAVSGPVGRGEALSLLRRLAAETTFQPEGPESPIQVVGLLEAAGLQFRHLWVMGLHDGVLPAPPRPNPFLPVSLQVAAEMPHASAEREADFARRVAERLFSSAPVVILSHPLREGDSGLLPSPLIRSIPVGEATLSASAAPAAVFRQAVPAAETLSDRSGPPLPVGHRASGGIAILRDQALCPFRAFARHRLRASSLETSDIGLNAGERGSLLHKAMELFWRVTRDQASLLTLDEGAFERRLREVVDGAVAALFPAESPSNPSPLLSLEKDRLCLLIKEWLAEVEIRRPPFSVLEEEMEEIIDCGGVEVATRIDRIDRLPDGRLLVIDYKTGPVDASDLIGERLIEPQLPVYGLGRRGDLAGVAFAGLRRGKCAFAGVAAEGGILPKVPPLSEWKKARAAGVEDWNALLDRWRRQLEELGRAFAAGEAAVDPADPLKACGRCDLTPLCRILEAEGGPTQGEGE